MLGVEAKQSAKLLSGVRWLATLTTVHALDRPVSTVDVGQRGVTRKCELNQQPFDLIDASFKGAGRPGIARDEENDWRSALAINERRIVVSQFVMLKALMLKAVLRLTHVHRHHSMTGTKTKDVAPGCVGMLPVSIPKPLDCRLLDDPAVRPMIRLDLD